MPCTNHGTMAWVGKNITGRASVTRWQAETSPQGDRLGRKRAIFVSAAPKKRLQQTERLGTSRYKSKADLAPDLT